MALLALGLILFLGTHSVRLFADGWRERQIERLGKQVWRGAYSLASIAGLALVVIGFGQAGAQEALWGPPLFMHHVTGLLVLLAFILIAASHVPGNHLKAKIGHPMVAGVKLWAFAHLLSNGQPRHIMLFGGFLVWAIADFAASRRRDRAAGVTYPAGTAKGDIITVVGGVVAWAVFAFVLHKVLIGVSPIS